ncbi:MAG: polysaccharide deacetylase family protein [Phycisphaerales bacterium]|nr:polysaccharide deacetylase family protein [Planctomycetota bacterium]MCH8507177.1 polysaccharide deacetylase family protein [Phycisphaerales bacterium]
MIAAYPPPTSTPWLVAAAILGTIVAAAVVLYALPLLIRARQVARWRKRAPGHLALTYDDGPDDTTTPAVLDLLDELGVPATFYLVGFRSELNPQTAALVRDSGHELGTHTHSHKNAWKKGPIFEFRDARRAYQTLDGIVPPNAPYRPPFGKCSLPTLLAMYAKDRRVDWWTAPANDSRDEQPQPAEAARRLLDTGGPVILMHSHHAEPNRRAFVLALTRELVRQGRERGRLFATVRQVREAAA